MNETLGAVGQTVSYTAPVEANGQDQTESLKTLAADMAAGKVDVLVVLGVNLAYVAPADLRIAEALDKVDLRIHFGLYEDETAERSHWHLPEAHALESWGDARAADGTVTIQQPLIAPLWGGLSPIEFISGFLGRAEAKGYDIVREHWKEKLQAADFEKQWKRALHDGIVKETTLPATAFR